MFAPRLLRHLCLHGILRVSAFGVFWEVRVVVLLSGRGTNGGVCNFGGVVSLFGNMVLRSTCDEVHVLTRQVCLVEEQARTVVDSSNLVAFAVCHVDMVHGGLGGGGGIKSPLCTVMVLE